MVEDSGGVGQGEAHDPHRSSSDRLVSGRAMTVRSGAPVLHCVQVGDGSRGRTGRYRAGRRCRLSPPRRGRRTAACRRAAAGPPRWCGPARRRPADGRRCGEPGLAQPPGDSHARPRCPPWCRCPLSRLSRCGCAGPPPGRDADRSLGLSPPGCPGPVEGTNSGEADTPRQAVAVGHLQPRSRLISARTASRLSRMGHLSANLHRADLTECPGPWPAMPRAGHRLRP